MSAYSAGIAPPDARRATPAASAPRRGVWPFVAIGLAVLLFGNAFPTAKICIAAMTDAELGTPALKFIPLRFVPASLIYLVMALTILRRECWGALREHPLRLILAGMFVVTGYNYCFNAGLEAIQPGVSALIIATAPIQTALLAWPLLGDRIDPRQVVGIAVAAVGLYIVIRWGQGHEVTPEMLAGAGITLLAPTMWALYTIMLKPVMAKHPPLAVTCVAVILGTLPLVPLFDVEGMGVLASTARSLGAWVFITVGATVLAFYLWNVPLKVITPTALAVFIYLIPLVALVFSILAWRNQRFNWWIMLGGAIIIVGVALANRNLWRRRSTAPVSTAPAPARPTR